MSSARQYIYQFVGRCSLLFDFLRAGLGKSRRWQPGAESSRELDKTGFVSTNSGRHEVLWSDEEVLFVRHGQLIHSFARAQEFSLIRNHRSFLQPPVLDLGCGDGSFASVLFTELEYGIDIDAEALKTASQFSLYCKLVKCSENRIPLDSGSARSIFSNSVLEHLSNLDAIMSEVHRILAPGGVLMFTVPLKQYERDLRKYFGVKASERINRESYHRNLLEASEWEQILGNLGFEIIVKKQYQPDWFTFWFRMLRVFGKRGLSAFVPTVYDIIWKKYQKALVRMVRESIRRTDTGGNVFIIARKN